MKALVLERYGQFGMAELPDPMPGPGQVRIKIKACAICGSDLHGYTGVSGRRIPPIIMGHEASGVVDALGEGAARFSVGRRVVFNSTLSCGECWFCRRGMQNICESARVFGVSCADYRLDGAMAEYITVPERLVYPLPDAVSFEHASLVEPISIALHAIRRAKIQMGDSVLVVGAGTIGLMLIKLLNRSNARLLIAADIDKNKLRLAHAAGAQETVDTSIQDIRQRVLALTGRGADVAFEAVGVPDTINTAIGCVRRGGCLTLLGNVSRTAELDYQRIVCDELLLAGSYTCTNEYETALEMISDGSLTLDDVISKAAPLEQGAEWFERLHAREAGLVKVVLLP